MMFWNAVGDIYLSICGVAAPFLLGVLASQVFSVAQLRRELSGIVDRIDKNVQSAE